LDPRSSPGTLSYQAIVLEPAGKWGSYFQTVARCDHRHATAAAAWECFAFIDQPVSDGQIWAVGVAE
jgi:hypothetical protein